MPEEQVKITAQEMKMATALMDQLTGAFEPQRRHEEYRAALERVIEAKLGAAQPIAAAPAPRNGEVRGLMEALKASIEATKRERSAALGAQAEARPKRRAGRAG